MRVEIANSKPGANHEIQTVYTLKRTRSHRVLPLPTTSIANTALCKSDVAAAALPLARSLAHRRSKYKNERLTFELNLWCLRVQLYI